MDILAALASLTALTTFAVHTFAGGPVVARPLLADTHLPPESKWLNYYCWHITTVLLAFMAVGFAAAAWSATYAVYLVFLAPLALTLSALSVWVALKGRIAPWRLPSTSMFALTGLLGLGAALT